MKEELKLYMIIERSAKDKIELKKELVPCVS